MVSTLETWLIIYLSCVASSTTALIVTQNKKFSITNIGYYVSKGMFVSLVVVAMTFLLFAAVMLISSLPIALFFQ